MTRRTGNEAEPTLPFEKTTQTDWNPPQLQIFCVSVLRSAFSAFQDVNIQVSFYPYVGLTHTLRRKKKDWTLRISDHCLSASSDVIESIVLILACKVMRRKPPRKWLDIYTDFRKSPEIEAAVRKRRKMKGRKFFSETKGRHHPIDEMYRELNEQFFNGQIEINRIGWGVRKSKGRLGHYDPIHHTITLSPALDSPRVPPFVVRYIVYHEMLHALFGESAGQEGRRHHPRQFRRTESAYPDYWRAKEFLESFGS
jgi:hypothetical protein